MKTDYDKHKKELGTIWEIDGIEFYEYPENPIYWISKCGVVYNAKKYFILTQNIVQSAKGYYTVNINRKRVKVHRMLAITFLNNPNNYPIIDHINNNSLDNSLENLRWATISMNNSNTTKRANTSSKYIGVSNKYKNTYTAKCLAKHLGTFKTETEAAIAYNTYAAKHGILHLNKINTIDNE